MSSMWSEIEKLKEKYNIVHWIVITLFFLGGLFVNATYKVIDWLSIPFDNSKDITVLLEKSEELTAFFESIKNVQSEMNATKQDNINLKSEYDRKLAELQNKATNMELELKASIRRLEDGQLQLFLKTERLDERTTRKNR